MVEAGLKCDGLPVVHITTSSSPTVEVSSPSNSDYQQGLDARKPEPQDVNSSLLPLLNYDGLAVVGHNVAAVQKDAQVSIATCGATDAGACFTCPDYVVLSDAFI